MNKCMWLRPRFKTIDQLCIFLAGLFHNKILFVLLSFSLLHTKQMRLKIQFILYLKAGEFSNHRTTIAISSNIGLILKDIYVAP